MSPLPSLSSFLISDPFCSFHNSQTLKHTVLFSGWAACARGDSGAADDTRGVHERARTAAVRDVSRVQRTCRGRHASRTRRAARRRPGHAGRRPLRPARRAPPLRRRSLHRRTHLLLRPCVAPPLLHPRLPLRRLQSCRFLNDCFSHSSGFAFCPFFPPLVSSFSFITASHHIFFFSMSSPQKQKQFHDHCQEEQKCK